MILLFLVLAAVLVVDLVLLAYDRYWTSFALFVATIAIAAKAGFDHGVFNLSLSDWIRYGLYYLIAGVGVAFLKWIEYTFKISSKVALAVAQFETKYVPPSNRAEINSVVDQGVAGIATAKADATKVVEYTADYLKAHRRNAFVGFVCDADHFSRSMWSNIMGLSDRQMPRINSAIVQAEDGIAVLFTPKARNYVGQITNWVCHWPVVVTWTVFENVLVKLGKHVATLFDTLFGRLGKAIIGRATKSL